MDAIAPHSGSSESFGCERGLGLPVEAAAAFAARCVTPLDDVETVALRRAAGRVLKTDVASTVPLPLFDHSAVDGYGVRSQDVVRSGSVVPVTGRTLAGDRRGRGIANAAYRIMTGAPVPPDCDAVIKQEHVLYSDGAITITDAVQSGANIRRRGEDVAVGETIARAGTVLDLRHVALLAACGVARVSVAPRIRIAIAAFGNELRNPGVRLRAGQIFDSNSDAALAFLARPLCRIVRCVRSGDHHQRAAGLLRELAADADLIVTSGGMAAGDADHTASALVAAGGAWHNAAFAMKPGNPARLGSLGNAAVLGLPGNPFAAIVALVVLGLPLLNVLSGASQEPKWHTARAAFDLARRPGRTEFFPARAHTDDAGTLHVERLGKGGSARLRPLVDADGLGRIQGDTADVAPGTSILFLPFSAVV